MTSPTEKPRRGNVPSTKLGDAEGDGSYEIASELLVKSAPLKWPESEPADKGVERYEIQARLGGGGMGDVFRAFDRHLERPVAIKRMKTPLLQNRQALDRFLTEAKAIAALNHFNIVQIYDFGRDSDGPYIVMEFVSGQSLAEKLKDRKPLELATAVELTRHLCDALSMAHGRGIVHRDIKPGNILVSEQGVPKLTDFGLARLHRTDNGHTVAGDVLGTLEFMAPEQRTNADRADGRSDLWSLAATLYQMLAAELPRVIRSDRIPESVRPVVLKALEEDLKDRYQSVAEFSEALDAALFDAASLARAGVGVARLGECPQCGLTNDVARKFCEKCGGSLRKSCVKCGHAVEVWAEFCGECGTAIAAAEKAKLTEIEGRKREIEFLEHHVRLKEAVARAEEMTQLEHPAFEEYASWAKKTFARLKEELTRLETRRAGLLADAEKCFSRSDYEGAARLLDDIPQPLRTRPVNELLASARRKQEICKQLSRQIREFVAAKDYAGLPEKVTRFLKLKPNDESAQRLARQVETHNLAAEIRVAVEKKQYEGLIPKVERFLELNPANENARLLLERLPKSVAYFTNSIGMKLTGIPAGEFLMGSADDDPAAASDERPQHRVQISQPFLLGIYPVTQAEFGRVTGRNPSQAQKIDDLDTSRFPVEQVSWDDAIEFCRRLSQLPQEREAGRSYRLPTEAEWEYACRGGTATPFNTGDQLSPKLCNCENAFPRGAGGSSRSLRRPAAVGSYRANGFGLFDMHGNVFEWCGDWYNAGSYASAPAVDPQGPASGTGRVVRGGSWRTCAVECRCAARRAYAPAAQGDDVGFRVVCIEERA